MAVYAQDKDKYSLKTPDGVAFADFKGYEDWPVVSSARTDEVLKGDRRQSGHDRGPTRPAFPATASLSRMAPKSQNCSGSRRRARRRLCRRCARRLQPGVCHGKGQQAISEQRRMGYALFNYDAASDTFTADPSPSDCGHACHVAVKAKDYIFHPYQKR